MRRLRLACCALLMSSAAVQAAPDPRYVQGKKQWLDQRYPPATELLVKVRKSPPTRNAQIDYMIGTGGCRTPGRRAWGLSFLDWALYRYSLTPGSRALLMRERDLCRGTARLPVLSGATATAALQTTAGSWAQGKMYHLEKPDEPVAVYSARPLDGFEAQAVTSRLVPVGRPDAIRAALRPVIPSGANLYVVSRYAFVTTAGQSDAEMDAMARVLDTYLAFLDQAFGVKLPPYYLTLYFVRTTDELQARARDLHKLDVSPATIGYTFQDDQSAVALIPGNAIGTLLHELFHLVVRTSFGDIPQWLDEGVAALYEESVMSDPTIAHRPGDRLMVRGVRNWRGPLLLEGWDKRPTLRDVITAQWYVSDIPSRSFDADGAPPSTQAVTLQFAVARYFALYLQEKGKLAEVMARIQALEPEPGADASEATLAAVIAVLGPIDRVQADFDTWFQATEAQAAIPNATPGVYEVHKYLPGTPTPPSNRVPVPCPPSQVQQQQQQQQQQQIPYC